MTAGERDGFVRERGTKGWRIPASHGLAGLGCCQWMDLLIPKETHFPYVVGMYSTYYRLAALARILTDATVMFYLSYFPIVIDFNSPEIIQNQ